MGAHYFVNRLEHVTFRGLSRCQLPFTCYLEDAIFSRELPHVVGVFAPFGAEVLKWIVLFSHWKDGTASCERVYNTTHPEDTCACIMHTVPKPLGQTRACTCYWNVYD